MNSDYIYGFFEKSRKTEVLFRRTMSKFSNIKVFANRLCEKKQANIVVAEGLLKLKHVI